MPYRPPGVPLHTPGGRLKPREAPVPVTDRPTEDDYFRHEGRQHACAKRLGKARCPVERADLLMTLGDGDWHQSRLHSALFGDDPYSPSDPTTQAEWLADGARMLWILAEAETARATGDPRAAEYWATNYDARTVELYTAVVPQLLAYTHLDRRPLIAEMCRIWQDMTGGQAVEGPWCMGNQMPRRLR